MILACVSKTQYTTCWMEHGFPYVVTFFDDGKYFIVECHFWVLRTDMYIKTSQISLSAIQNKLYLKKNRDI